MGGISNDIYSDTSVSPLSPPHVTSDKYQSLIHDFKTITITCPDSMQFPPVISPNLNKSSKHPHSTGGTGVYISKSGPPNNYAIEEVIPEICGHESDQTNSFWVSFNSDVEE